MRRFAILALLLAVAPARAEVINGFDPSSQASYDTYARFASGWPNSPVANSSTAFVGAGLDLSGIGWRVSGGTPSTASVTLISPQYVIGASHFGVGPAVTFAAADGSTVTRQVTSTYQLTTTYKDSQGVVHTLPSDILVGRLDSPIAAATGVRPLAIAAPGSVNPGQSLLVYGQNSSYGGNNFYLGRNTLAGVDPKGSFNPDANGDPQGEATMLAVYTAGSAKGNGYLTSGDSGGPLLARGGPGGNTAVLIGGHYGVSNPNVSLTGYADPADESASSFLADTQYITQLDDLMRPDGYQVLLVPVPEPAGLLAVAGLMLLAVRRTGRRGHGASLAG